MTEIPRTKPEKEIPMARKKTIPPTEIYLAKASPAKIAELSARIRNKALQMAARAAERNREAEQTALELRRLRILHKL